MTSEHILASLFINNTVQQKWDIFDDKIKECEDKFFFLLKWS